MRAIAVLPGKPNSIHLAELPKPSVHEIPNGRGVLVQVLRVGVDGTDKEINAAEYGQAPPGYDFLVIGHECFGRVLEVGRNVTEFVPGDYVVPDIDRGKPQPSPTSVAPSQDVLAGLPMGRVVFACPPFRWATATLKQSGPTW